MTVLQFPPAFNRRRAPRVRVEFLTVGAENGKGLYRDFPDQPQADAFADQIAKDFEAMNVPLDVTVRPI